MRLIDAEKEIATLQKMLDVLIDEGDKTAVRFAINTLSGAEYENSYTKGFLDGYKAREDYEKRMSNG